MIKIIWICCFVDNNMDDNNNTNNIYTYNMDNVDSSKDNNSDNFTVIMISIERHGST